MALRKPTGEPLDLLELRVGVARDFKPLTQAQVARRANVTQSAISSIESGRRAPSHMLAFRLAGIYRCHHDDVMAAAEETMRRVMLDSARRKAKSD